MINLSLNDAEALVHFEKVKPLLQNRIRNVLTKGIKRKKLNVRISSNLRNYLDSLLNDDNLRILVTSHSFLLKQIASQLKLTNPDFFGKKSNSNFILRNVFIDYAYDNSLFDKLEFIKSINIDTCPYCNRNYIYFLSKDKKIKPQIDHFYPKSKYPFFAVSFYNLIPSCQTCNGFGAKEEKDPIEEDLVNPYDLKSTDFKLSYTINSINALNPLLNKNSVTIKFIKKLKGHIDVFKLEEFYQQHSDHALELIIKSRLKYSSQYRDYLKTYSGFKFSDEEIDRLILGNYSTIEEMHKRPLAKLYQDLGRELGLINT